MPSGAKKRKAAKKKKKLQEKYGHNINNGQFSNSVTSTDAHSHGAEDLRHDDDRETNGREVSTPATQDHKNHQHQLTEGTLHSIESSEKENEERDLGVMDKKTRVSDGLVDTGLEKMDKEANAVLYDDAVATSDANPSAAAGNKEKVELSYDTPTVHASVRANEMKGSPHDDQRPVALVPRPLQTTSWKSCCGLFEVFAGSNK